MPRDLSDLAHSVAALPSEIQKSQRAGVAKSALYTAKTVRAEMMSATGDMRMSGVGKRGAKLNAGYDVVGTVNPSAIVQARGPMQLIERDTKAHKIPKERSARSKRKKKILALPGGRFYARVNHPGTKGKHPFSKGVAKAAPLTGKIFDAEVEKAIVRSFTGKGKK